MTLVKHRKVATDINRKLIEVIDGIGKNEISIESARYPYEKCNEIS